jgi:uncharacterized ion transporter superfamily protein YfcC
MENNRGAAISRNSFIQSFIILFVLMILAGVLTRVIPAGSFTRLEQNGVQVIQPGSYVQTTRPDYPIWRWFTAPVEVLGADGSLTVIVILIFLLMVGAAFSVLQYSGILEAVIGNIIHKFGGQKYLLLLAISLFFMILGGFFGIIEEIVPLVPIMVALAIYLGWDSLTGLGMSLLAVNLGFSTAITNPFTIGVAQKLSGLPLFSGAALRLFFFVVVYAIFAVFIIRYVRMIEKNPEKSPVWSLEQAAHLREQKRDFSDISGNTTRLKPALIFFAVWMALIAVVLFASPFVSFLSSYALPIVAICFLIAGLGAGFLSGAKPASIWKAAGDGALGIAPGIPLILMASSIRLIVANGGIMDTILFSVSNWIQGATPFGASLLVYLLALVIEFFIGSGSAKAFLLMPILVPLSDLVGVTRQITVTAYCFGDGFSNLIYPTNPVLLIALGLTVISYPKWFKWTMKLWVFILPVTVLFLLLAVGINFGPF